MADWMFLASNMDGKHINQIYDERRNYNLTWEEYYDKFYDWAESTQIKKLSSVERYGSADEVTEIMLEFTFSHEEITNRMARKAIEQNIIFSAENLQDLTNNVDEELLGQLALQSASALSKEDLQQLDGFLDDDALVELYQLKGLQMPEDLAEYAGEYDTDSDMDDVLERAKQPTGFFSRLAMAFAIGEGARRGIGASGVKKSHKYRVGDHIRVKYRGQEGIIIDINGGLYMVFLADGSHVDSYYENQIERAW